MYNSNLIQFVKKNNNNVVTIESIEIGKINKKKNENEKKKFQEIL